MERKWRLEELAKERWGEVEKGRINISLPIAILLRVAMAGGLLAIALVAPNAMQLFAPLVQHRHKSSFYRSGMSKRLEALANQRLVTIGEANGITTIRLTAQGRQKILSFTVGKMKIKPQHKWDGKWRVVAFDVPEKKRLSRDVFRTKLKELGFKEMQRSVWVHKYPCLDEIQFLAHLYEVGSNVVYFEGVAPKPLV